MMQWWRKLWRKPQTRTIQRSSKAGESLTEDEQRLLFDTGRCVDCDGDLVPGPRRAMATDYCCGECHSEFTLTVLPDRVIGERISDAGPRKLGDRAQRYGL